METWRFAGLRDRSILSTMAPMKVSGRMRIGSTQTGTTKWREGSFEIVEKDNLVSLVVHFRSGGPTTTFQLSHNVEAVRICPSEEKKQQSRLLLTLRDRSRLVLDRAPSTDARLLKEYLDHLSREKHQLEIKSHQGILGSRVTSKEPHRHLSAMEDQTPARRDQTPARATPSSPGRASLQQRPKAPQASGTSGSRMATTLAPTPLTLPRTALSENRSERRVQADWHRAWTSCLQ